MDARKPRERLLGPALRTQPDRRLVALARDGSEPAQEEIVRRYRAGLVRYAGSIAGAAAAEDVVQEALAKGMTGLGRADDQLRLRPWLYAIVRNTALNHLRDTGPATEQLDENYDGVEQPPQALERRELVRSLVGGLRGLPAQQREALVKRELEGRSHDEIGAQLGVSSGAARQLIFRARESLRVGFGALLPMPLLRWLAEGGGDGAAGVAAGAGGGALAAKAAVAVLAAGAAVTAGVAIDHAGHRRAQPPAAEAAVRSASPSQQPAVVTPQTAPRTESVVAPSLSSSGKAGEQRGSSGPSGGGGDSSSGPGPGEQQAVEHGSAPGPSGHSGPGPSGGGDSSDGGGHGDRSGHGGPGNSGGGDDSGSGSSNSGRDGSHSGSGDNGGSSHSGSGSDDSSGGGGGSDGSGGGSSGGSSSDGGGSDVGGDAVVATPTPAAAPSSSGPGSGTTTPASPPPVIESEPLPEASRDLSGGSVSQGSEDPD